MAAEGISQLADDEDAELAERTRRLITRRSATTPRPKQKEKLSALMKSIRSCWRRTRSWASRWNEQKALAGVAVDAVFDSVSVATTFKEELEQGGRDLLLDHRSDSQAPGTGQAVPRHGRAAFGQLLRDAEQSAVFTDGSFVYVPKGVKCPMELSTYFRINARTPASSSAR
jgi:Fe-S cluster assembly protein SufB